MIAIQSVSAENLVRVWPSVAPILKRATDMSHGRLGIEDLRASIFDGTLHLWLVLDGDKVIAANTLQMKSYPRMRVMLGLYIGGERLEEWRDLMCEAVERYAREQGCQKVEFIGRPGWGRVLSSNGYAPAFTSYEKAL